MTLASRLAQHVASSTYEALPSQAVRFARSSLLDTLAVAVAAREAPGVRAVCENAVSDGGRTASALWTRKTRVPPRAAAFANAYMASALDFDSLHEEAVAHADIVIVPTALAVGEDAGLSGKALLAAIAVGDDALCRLCLSTRGNTGWFYTSLYGPLASAAVTAKLLGGDAAAIEAAMGIASMSASGTQQPAVERSMGKRMQGALAAGAGVQAGYLARRGLEGPREMLEGRFGLYAMHEQGQPEALTRDLGTHYENTRIGYKLYPSCQCNHAAIEGMLHLRAGHALTAQNVERIEVTVSPYMQRLVGAAFAPGGNPQVAAQFSVQYSIAAVLMHGRLGVREISADAVIDPAVADLVRRIRVVVDPDNRNNYAPVRLQVTKADGTAVTHEAKTYRGSAARPLTDRDLKEKLAMCIEAAGGTSDERRVERAYECVMNVDEVRDVTSFTRDFFAHCLA